MVSSAEDISDKPLVRAEKISPMFLQSPTFFQSWGFFWLVVLLVGLPLMVPYCAQLWRMKHYQFFPFAYAVVAWLTYSRWDRGFRPPLGWLSWFLVVGGLLLTVLGMFAMSPWLGTVGLFLVVTAFLIACHGEEDASLVGLAIPLALTIHLPLAYDQILTIKLQRLTTSLSSVFLDLLTIPHAVENNVIQLSTRELFVAEACSGVQSVFTLMFVASVLIALNRRPLWFAPFYLAIATLMALAANILRVTTVAVGDVWFDIDLASGWQHETVGYLALALAMMFLLSFDQLCVAILHPVDSRAFDGRGNPFAIAWNSMLGVFDQNENPTGGPIARALGAMEPVGRTLWQRVVPRTVILVFCMVAMMYASIQAYHIQNPTRILANRSEILWSPSPDIIKDLEYDTIRITQHEIAREKSNPRLGENADIWNYETDDAGLPGQIVLSQPYAGWHELCFCYEAANWLLLDRKIKQAKVTDGQKKSQDREDKFALAIFKREQGQFAYLFYAGFDSGGNTLHPPSHIGRLSTRFGALDDSTQILMFQMLVVLEDRISPSLLNKLTNDFLLAKEAIGNGLKTHRSE